MTETNCKSLGRENIVGSCLMILSMAAFAGEDSVIKVLSNELPVSQILFVIGIGGAIVFATIGLLLKENFGSGDKQFTNACSDCYRNFWPNILFPCTLSNFFIFNYNDFASNTFGCSNRRFYFFNEKVGVIRWLAIGLGFIGVLMIISPEEAEFSLLSLLAIFGMLGFAFRDLASRAASPKLNIFTLGCHGFLSLAFAGLILSLILRQPFLSIGNDTWLFLAAGVSLGVVGYGSLISAMRIGEVSAITPFRYTRLIFGLSIGYFIFNEHVGINAAIGCVLIVLSSFTVLYRGRT